MQPSNCLTRVVIDGAAIDLVQLGAIHARIQHALTRFPAAERSQLANALLDLAVLRIVQERSG
jgi:hypothetical protein